MKEKIKSFIELLNKNQGVAIVILTFFLIIVTGYYAYQTTKMARTMKLEFDTNYRPYLEVTEPSITLFNDKGEKLEGNTIRLENAKYLQFEVRLINQGKVPAHLTKVESNIWSFNQTLVNQLPVVFPGQSKTLKSVRFSLNKDIVAIFNENKNKSIYIEVEYGKNTDSEKKFKTSMNSECKYLSPQSTGLITLELICIPIDMYAD